VQPARLTPDVTATKSMKFFSTSAIKKGYGSSHRRLSG
jgi:hypothetical protein